MTKNVDRMLEELTPAIEEKCEELKKIRRECLQNRIFVLLCGMVLLIPSLLVFFGVSLTVMITPVVFMSLSVILLLPVLLTGKSGNQGGLVYEQA